MRGLFPWKTPTGVADDVAEDDIWELEGAIVEDMTMCQGTTRVDCPRERPTTRETVNI